MVFPSTFLFPPPFLSLPLSFSLAHSYSLPLPFTPSLFLSFSPSLFHFSSLILPPFFTNAPRSLSFLMQFIPLIQTQKYNQKTLKNKYNRFIPLRAYSFHKNPQLIVRSKRHCVKVCPLSHAVLAKVPPSSWTPSHCWASYCRHHFVLFPYNSFHQSMFLTLCPTL